jgi:hypothetical protein
VLLEDQRIFAVDHDLGCGPIAEQHAVADLILDPELKNPQTGHWQRSMELFDLLL